jgi:hypothetical protein
MKLLTTFLCALAFAIAGISLADTEANKTLALKHQTLSAATITAQPVLPTLNFGTRTNPSMKDKTEKEYVPYEVIVVKDTTAKAPKVITKKLKGKRTPPRATVKRQGYSIPAAIPDSAVQNQVRGVREEYASDSVGPPKGSICLIVDDKVVYKR